MRENSPRSDAKACGSLYFTIHLLLEVVSFYILTTYVSAGAAWFLALFYDFFASIGIPMQLGELGVKAETIDEMADHILENDSTNEPWMFAPLDKAALLRILNASM